jgi:TonB-dependent starch-binding outer membrane protein SusC
MDKVILFFLLTLSLHSQAQKQVTGKVIDAEDGQAVIGATVIVQGTTVGTITDIDGAYSLITNSAEDKLLFSLTGYDDQVLTIGNVNVLNVTLSPSISDLQEVVVTGYGTQKRSNISGSVATIKSRELEDKPILRVEQALQGRAAGVQVAQVSGSPGSPLTVRIRGVGTINNSDPLYIVDGIPVDGLDFLNPRDIETMNILKDAASAAIYGARGANGVVLITTKSGKKNQQGTISYEGYFGSQRPSRLLELLNATEYATLQNEAYLAAGKVPLPEFANPQALGRGTDWQEAIFQEAPIMSHQLTMAGGGEKTTYTISSNYFTQDGIVGGPKANFKRATTKINATNEVKPWLLVGTNIGFTWLERKGLSENNEYNSPIIRALNIDPTTPVYKADGTFAYSDYADTDIANPVNGITQTHNKWQTNRVVGSIFSDVKLSKNLKFRSTLSTDVTFAVSTGFNPKYDLSNIPSISEAPPAEKSVTNSVGIGHNTWKNWQIENFLTYQKVFNDKHDVTIIGGTSALANRYDGSGGSNTNLPSNDPKDAYISNTIDPIESQTAYQFATESSLLSYFGKSNYTYDNKYIASATLRRDGSSKFGKNNRYGLFPSFSAGWKVSQESFWKSKIINDLKLRASWGQNGNDRIGDYSFATVVLKGQNYVFGPNENITNGSVALASANPDLQWETSTQTDIGVDAEFWDGKVNFTADYYIKKTSDMLYAAQIPLTAGTEPSLQNVATALNKGLELSLGYRDRSAGGIKYSIEGNVAFVDSKVTGLGLNSKPIFSGTIQSANSQAAKTDIGHPIASFFGYVTDGIFQTNAEVEAHAFQADGTAPGDIRFKDFDNNDTINQFDRMFIGNPTPKFVFGLNCDFSYKNFDLNLFIQGSQGNDIYNNTTRYDFIYVNRPASVLERWTGPGTSTSQPRVNLNDGNQNARISDRFVEDGSYVRLKAFQIGYNLSQEWLKKIKCRNMKVYVTGQNLLTFTNYSGYDPEIGNVGGSLEIGIDRGFYPQARTFIGGVNFTF